MLYLGDTSLSTAACYLAGVLHRAGYPFEYRPSDHQLTAADLAAADNLLILSDYPAARISPELQQQLVERHRQGMSLLMIGGWESFQGCAVHWRGTLLGDVLPVIISTADDRQNLDGPAFIHCDQPHPITANLPWTGRPPLIGGYNEVQAAADAQVLLSIHRHTARWDGSHFSLTPTKHAPLLIVRDANGSRSAALTTDLAPHWVGPLVDWGPERVTAQHPDAETIEVGDLYVQLIQQLIGWLCRTCE